MLFLLFLLLMLLFVLLAHVFFRQFARLVSTCFSRPILLQAFRNFLSIGGNLSYDPDTL